MILNIYLPGPNDDVLAATLPSSPGQLAGVVFSVQSSVFSFHGAGTMTNYKLKVEWTLSQYCPLFGSVASPRLPNTSVDDVFCLLSAAVYDLRHCPISGCTVDGLWNWWDFCCLANEAQISVNFDALLLSIWFALVWFILYICFHFHFHFYFLFFGLLLSLSTQILLSLLSLSYAILLQHLAYCLPLELNDLSFPSDFLSDTFVSITSHLI